MPDRQFHQREVRRFLEAQFRARAWEFTLPHGWGQEAYFAHGDGEAYFVKLGVQAARYEALACAGLTPPVLAAGYLEDSTAIIVQPYIEGRNPTRRDYRAYLEQFAEAIRLLHHNPELLRLLPAPASELYCDAGLEALSRIRQKWLVYRAQVMEHAQFVDQSLAELAQRVGRFQGGGLAASHNDICNANWLVTAEGRVYLIDLESMSRDDPALDIGATLWWYYPPALRGQFLEIAGHAGDRQFEDRMQVRMAMHCLDIALPRPQSFDQFTPETFADWLVDYRAAFEGSENPQGYE